MLRCCNAGDESAKRTFVELGLSCRANKPLLQRQGRCRAATGRGGNATHAQSRSLIGWLLNCRPMLRSSYHSLPPTKSQMLVSKTRKAIVLAVGLLLPAACAGIAEYSMTGGESTWIPMLSSLLGAAVAWPLLWWFAIRPGDEWVELFSTIITLEKPDGRTSSVAVKPFRPASVRELRVELTVSDVETCASTLGG